MDDVILVQPLVLDASMFTTLLTIEQEKGIHIYLCFKLDEYASKNNLMGAPKKMEHKWTQFFVLVLFSDVKSLYIFLLVENINNKRLTNVKKEYFLLIYQCSNIATDCKGRVGVPLYEITLLPYHLISVTEFPSNSCCILIFYMVKVIIMAVSMYKYLSLFCFSHRIEKKSVDWVCRL